MEYMYYVGCASGVSKKTGNPWWSINVLRENQWGSIEVKPLYVATEEKWKALLATCPPIGTPVHVSIDIDRVLTKITTVKDVPTLDLR